MTAILLNLMVLSDLKKNIRHGIAYLMILHGVIYRQYQAVAHREIISIEFKFITFPSLQKIKNVREISALTFFVCI